MCRSGIVCRFAHCCKPRILQKMFKSYIIRFYEAYCHCLLRVPSTDCSYREMQPQRRPPVRSRARSRRPKPKAPVRTAARRPATAPPRAPLRPAWRPPRGRPPPPPRIAASAMPDVRRGWSPRRRSGKTGRPCLGKAGRRRVARSKCCASRIEAGGCDEHAIKLTAYLETHLSL